MNAVDDPANATAYLGGAIARGGVTVAFSTGGQAPALAGLLREALDEIVPADVGTWLERAHELSQKQRIEGVPMAARRPQLLETLNHLYETAARLRLRTPRKTPRFGSARPVDSVSRPRLRRGESLEGR